MISINNYNRALEQCKNRHPGSPGVGGGGSGTINISPDEGCESSDGASEFSVCAKFTASSWGIGLETTGCYNFTQDKWDFDTNAGFVGGTGLAGELYGKLSKNWVRSSN